MQVGDASPSGLMVKEQVPWSPQEYPSHMCTHRALVQRKPRLQALSVLQSESLVNAKASAIFLAESRTNSPSVLFMFTSASQMLCWRSVVFKVRNWLPKNRMFTLKVGALVTTLSMYKKPGMLWNAALKASTT